MSLLLLHQMKILLPQQNPSGRSQKSFGDDFVAIFFLKILPNVRCNLIAYIIVHASFVSLENS